MPRKEGDWLPAITPNRMAYGGPIIGGEKMQDQLLCGYLQKICNSLDNIDRTLAEPKNISAHRVAANRRISNAIDYIVHTRMVNDETIANEEAPQEVKDVLIYHKGVLDKIREILLKRE